VERGLEREGIPIPLTPKAFDTLLLLVSSGNRLVDKKFLLASVWGGVHVGESVLTRAISDLRKALQQTEGEVWIETVPKFGYRFVAEVRNIGNSPCAVPPHTFRTPWGRRVLKAVVPLVAATGLVFLLIPRTHSNSGARHLAVLPFQFIGETGGESAMGAGVTDALITRLSNLSGVIVRPMSTVRRYDMPGVDPLAAGQELKVDVVLEGTLQRSDSAVQARVRLIRPSDGTALWAETVESHENRLFALQASLAQQVAAHLAVKLSAEDRRGLEPGPELNPAAHRLYVNGRYEWGKRSREGFEKASEYFRQAIDLDPGYARAYAGLADCYLLLGLYGYYPPLEMLPKAKTAALHALTLAPRLAEVHATLGLVAQNLDWDWPEVERHYREAIRLAPNYSTAHHWYAEFLSILGRFDESRAEFARARGIDPISSIIQADEAQLYFFERKYGRSRYLLEKVVRENLSFALAHERLALLDMIEGREEEAWGEVQLLPECGDEESDCRQTWAAWLARRDAQGARRALEQLEAKARTRRIASSALLIAHIRQGNTGRALDWLEYMAEKHEVWLITAKVNPLFDALRPLPRARAILARLHLN
jgi:TolB-like protein